MGLTLNTLRCPDFAVPESRQVSGGEFSIGRGPDNDWVLADPERQLSKRHCLLAFRSGAWQVADVSANGTFINHETAPIGRAPRTLRDGDRLRAGSYEIEVSIQEAASRAPAPSHYAPSYQPPQDNDDPFAEPACMAQPWDDTPLPGPHSLSGHSVQLPSDFDPLHGDHDLLREPTQADHSPAIHDRFQPPPIPASGIPDDWDLDVTGGAVPAPAANPAPMPTPRAVAAPQLPPTLPPQPPAPVSAPAPTADLLAAFLKGAGVTDIPTDPAGTLAAIGAALRATVSGIRRVLIDRAKIKSEFRIEQTMIQARGNNPLKFSADDDDALAAFLGLGRRHAMPADQAVTEALDDIRRHELATITAMQSAVRALLAQFDPAALEKTVDKGTLTKLPGQRKARAWDAFAAQHSRVSQALSDDFDSVFGKAFARAYEQAIQDSSRREDRPR